MLCLFVGASLMASLDADRKAGLECLIEHFTEKGYDNFEKCDDEHKIMVLGISYVLKRVMKDAKAPRKVSHS